MTTNISLERFFSSSCFEGLRLFRRYQVEHPDLSSPELLLLIERVEPDASSLDMEASVHLSDIVRENCPIEDGPAFYQSCISAVLLEHKPTWFRSMHGGRRRFISALQRDDQDALDVFRIAGLMDNQLLPEVVAWWDQICDYARFIPNQEKKDQSRRAEMLTIEHERKKLKRMGIPKEPEWPGLDDNFAGYDVLSYVLGASGPTSQLIEVKSTSVSPLRFFITSNEWQVAQKSGTAYIFHIWDMRTSSPQLHARTVPQIAPHIPTNNGKGDWKNAEILI